MTPVVWTISAQDDLAAIRANVARVSEAAAARLRARLTDRSQLLEEQPRMGRTIPEFNNELLRELIEGEYRILYEVFPDRVKFWGIAYGRERLNKDQR